MAWRDRLLPASFRAVPFFIREHHTPVTGRRVEVHEYPGQDNRYTEDLGEITPSYDLDAYVLGDDYTFARDRLIRACNEREAGTLIHPYLGVQRVVCVDCRIRESTREGALARVYLRFVDAGQNLFPTRLRDTLAAVLTGAISGQGSLVENFVTVFDLEGIAGSYVTDALDGLINRVFEDLPELDFGIGGFDPLNIFDSRGIGNAVVGAFKITARSTLEDFARRGLRDFF